MSHKADYKAGFVLSGVLIFVTGIIVKYYSTEIVNLLLNIDIYPIKKGMESYPLLQTKWVETLINIISICADIGGIVAIIYGFVSKSKKKK